MKVKKTYIAILVSAVLITGVYIAFDTVFKVQNIVVSPLIPSESATIDSIRGLTSLYKTNILFLSSETVAKDIKENNPRVKSATIIKKYPHTLMISVGLYHPSAYLQVNSGYLLLSDEGNIIEKIKTPNDPDIPIIKYYQQFDYYGFQSGDTISYKDITTALRLLIKALDLGFMINNIDISGLSMIVLNANNKRFIFTTEKDISAQEYQFLTIVKKLRAEGKEFKSLDLRFDKPVISL